MTSLKRGDIVRETYTVEEQLGSGAFGDVYLVRHRYMGMQAMKILDRADNPGDRESGLNEAFLLSKIAHPNIVRVYEANHINSSSDSPLYVTMEYVNGSTLREIITLHEATLPIENCISMIRQAAAGLSHAHSMTPKIVHRDIRPENLLIRQTADEDCLLVADFGLASSMNKSLGLVPAAGALQYESPEGIDGYETPRSDIFSLGLCLYELLTGVFPFKITAESLTSYGGDFRELVREAHKEVFPPPSYFRSTIPPEVEATVNLMMSLDQKRRLPDGTAAEDALRRCSNCSLNHTWERQGLAKQAFSEVVQLLEQALLLMYIDDNHSAASQTFQNAANLSTEFENRFNSFID